MKFRRHWLVSTLLTVLYGGMMLFGQGLHELVDCDHCHGHAHGHADAGHEHTSGHADHDHGTEGSHTCDHYVQTPVQAATDGGTPEDSDCPICQFHSQGQLRAPADAPTERRAPTITLSRTTPLVWTEFTLGVHSPRGPPA